MRQLNHSSGDFVADRRAAYARAAADDLAFAEAAELMQQALELAPGWTAGWCLLGDYRAEAGDLAGAIAAYEELARLDAEGIFGAALKLAARGAAPAPRGTETSYVEALFDDYATRFEAELVGRLGYSAPQHLAGLVADELARCGAEQVGHAIDLGCGTGLMGERLRRSASFLEGVDLSTAMVEEAGRKGIYDRLEKAELVAFLGAHAGAVDLLAAADVLNYCGELRPVLQAAARVLVPGGLFAFTLELHGGTEPLLLGPTLRYAHNAELAMAGCRAAGFEIVQQAAAVLRHDRGAPVEGLLVLLRRPATVAELPGLVVVEDDDSAVQRLDG